jgi:cell division septal protein FtsQ
MAKRIARKKPQRFIPWKMIFGAMLCVNLVLACQFSKVTAIRNVNLNNVRNTERDRIAAMLAEIKGIPALQLKPRKIERRFTGQSRILTADFRRNVFGVASLTLVYRKPVAQFEGDPQVFLDETGYVFGDPEIKPEIPKLKLHSALKVTVVAMAGVINYGDISELAKLVQKELVGPNDTADSIEIEVAETGGVSLSMRGAQVILGTSKDLPQKIEALKSLIATDSNVFNNVTEINLMAPERPVVKRKAQNTP